MQMGRVRLNGGEGPGMGGCPCDHENALGQGRRCFLLVCGSACGAHGMSQVRDVPDLLPPCGCIQRRPMHECMLRDPAVQWAARMVDPDLTEGHVP